MEDKIVLAHGSGGLLSKQLMQTIFLRYLHNPELGRLDDSSVVAMDSSTIAFTTDSFTVDPIFFNGGDIGKLSVCGTVNNLAVAGAIPLYLSAAFILEEGLAIKDLEKIVNSMSNSAFECGVKIVSSDVKVIERGLGSGIIINTTGIGMMENNNYPMELEEGDKVIISGPIGEHELAILVHRNKFRTNHSFSTDCAPVHTLTRSLFSKYEGKIKKMKDPTRGGIVTALNKIIDTCRFGIILEQESLPIKSKVKNICSILGLNPLYLANQGKILLICAADAAQGILELMHKHPLGRNAAVIGEVTHHCQGRLILRTTRGEQLVLGLKSGSESFRIC